MPKELLLIKITSTFSRGWRYFTFIVNAIKNTIVKNIILNMYFNIATTSFPDYMYRNQVA